MKKYLALSLLLSTALLSCKKENGSKKSDEPKANQFHAATFNVNDFSLSSGALTTNGLKTDALKDQIKYLQYSASVWQESGHDITTALYRYQQHESTATSFGLIRDSLEDGRYHMCFVGTDVLGKLDIGTIPLSGGSQHPRPTYFLNYKSLTPNMFYAYLDTTVAGSPIQKPIVLTRMVSKVTVHLKDAVPVNAAKFVLTFVDYPSGMDLISGSGLSRGRRDEYNEDAVFEFPVKSEHKGKKDMELCAIVFPYYYPEVSLKCLDAQGKVIAHKILPKNLSAYYTILQKNIEYKFTGYMFGQTANFGITVDTKWNTPIDIPFSIAGKTQKLF